MKITINMDSLGQSILRRTLLAVSLFFWGCAGPSLAGFPHSNMHPLGDNEFAIVPHGGRGVVAGESGGPYDLGGMLSYAHDFGNLGMSIAGGAYLTDVGLPNIHVHIEFAHKLRGKYKWLESGNDILFGVGYSDNLETRVPQLSVGFMHGANLFKGGVFGGCRFSAGPMADREFVGAAFYLSGALGYQWWARSVFGFSMQIVPLFGVFAIDSPGVVLGAVAMLSFTFGNR